MLARVPVRSLSWRTLRVPPSPRFASALISARRQVQVRQRGAQRMQRAMRGPLQREHRTR